jgi:hypothetical protein
LAPGSSSDPVVNGILDFSKKGFGDTQMFGLLARRPELLKRAAAMFAYFLGGQGLTPFLRSEMPYRHPFLPLKSQEPARTGKRTSAQGV